MVNQCFTKTCGTLLGLIWLILIGCGAKGFDYHSDNEIPNTPGVFAKDPEGVTIYSSETGLFGKNATEKTDTVQKGEAKAETLAGSGKEAAETDEYREFQEWRKEKKEFEEFQRWKKSKQGSREYQEFLQWQKWREFKNWEKNNKNKN